MPRLPVHTSPDRLEHWAEALLDAAQGGDPDAVARIRAVSDHMILASAQFALARDYGFSGWAALKMEVDRREILTQRDLSRLHTLLAVHPEMASRWMEHWSDHKRVGTLNFVAMLRFDHRRLGLPPELPGTGATARALIAAGAPVDGHPGEPETPLITAASYGDAEVAQVLIEAGADIEACAAPDAGGVPGATALVHAAVFGMTEVLDLLVGAGARIRSIEEAAAAGDIVGWLTPETPLESRVRALVMAADHQRLSVIDQLIAAGTPVDAEDTVYGRQALRVAAQNGRPASVRRLLDHGADPGHRDPTHGRTALDWSRLEDRPLSGSGYVQVEAMLAPAAHTEGL